MPITTSTIAMGYNALSSGTENVRMASRPKFDTTQENTANPRAHMRYGTRGTTSAKYGPQQLMSPMQTFRHASRKIAATTTVPTAPKCIPAEAARISAPFVAPGSSAATPRPTIARPQ